MTAKSQTLPDDFDRGARDPYSIGELEAIFSTVDVDARGGYSQEVALAAGSVDAAGAAWLLDRGADIEAQSRFGAPPLVAQARLWRPDVVAVLLARGAVVDSYGRGDTTALLAAANKLDLATVDLLLAAGADAVTRFGSKGYNALDKAIFGVTVANGSRATPVVRRLAAAGATVGEAAAGHLRTTLRQARKAHLRSGELGDAVAALEALHDLVGVEQPDLPRVLGPEDPITVTQTDWKKRYQELWELLVPAGGAAATVQGEVIRIVGRVGDELLRNGGGNWDDDFELMLDVSRPTRQPGSRWE